MGWSDKTEAWRQRVLWLRRVAGGAADDRLPDLSDAALEDTLEQWLAPLLPGVTSKSALHRLDGDGLLRCQLSYQQQTLVEEACPTHIRVPSAGGGHARGEALWLNVRLGDGGLSSPPCARAQLPSAALVQLARTIVSRSTTSPPPPPSPPPLPPSLCRLRLTASNTYGSRHATTRDRTCRWTIARQAGGTGGPCCARACRSCLVWRRPRGGVVHINIGAALRMSGASNTHDLCFERCLLFVPLPPSGDPSAYPVPCESRSTMCVASPVAHHLMHSALFASMPSVDGSTDHVHLGLGSSH